MILTSLLLTACGEEGASNAPPPGRVVAVAAEDEPDPAEELCDARPTGDDAPRLAFPALAEGHTAPSPIGRRWVNVWATWCRPCVEEMPLIERWKDQLRADGVDAEVVFLSADTDDATVATFREQHTNMPESLRIADPEALGDWASSVGLVAGASLPLHVFTDADGRVVCARGGAITEGDYEAVRAVLRGGDG